MLHEKQILFSLHGWLPRTAQIPNSSTFALYVHMYVCVRVSLQCDNEGGNQVYLSCGATMEKLGWSKKKRVG